MSILLKFAERIMPLASDRRVYTLGTAALKAWLDGYAEKRSWEPPRFVYRRCAVETKKYPVGPGDERPCYTVRAPGADAGDGKGRVKAILFLHGGGYVAEAHAIHWNAVTIIAGRLNVPVVFPVYPLFPKYRAEDMLAMIAKVYADMLAQFRPEEIAVLGDSAGGALTLTLCHHAKKAGLPMPGRIITLSPVDLIERDAAVKAELERRKNIDVMLSTEFMASMAEGYGLEKADDMFYIPMTGDFRGFPKADVFAGTAECFYPQIAPFMAKLKDAGVDARLHAGEGMMHVWPYIPFVPECRATLEEIIGLLGD